MAKIRNVSGDDRTLPWLDHRLVLAGAVVEVPIEHVFNYTCQTIWEPVDEEAQAEHDAAVASLTPVEPESVVSDEHSDESSEGQAA